MTSRSIFRLTLLSSILAATCLAGCASRHTYRSEPTAPPRSQKPYTVNGERYEPLASHEGFVQNGMASWYGRDFHGRQTSNGERYDMYAMTAAHKTLPLGVYVRVDNLENGRTTTVRINDRGPFVAGRIIDLSYSAAQDLGMAERGLAKVRIAALGYLEQAGATPRYRQPTSYDRGRFGVQVGAFRVQENARGLVRQMERLYGSAAIREAVIDGTRYYRVVAGSYLSLKAAEQFKAGSSDKLVRAGFVVAMD